MFYPLVSFIALRYIKSGRRGYVSFISLISMLGMALGVMALIVVLAVMNGFKQSATTRILGVVPHLIISNKNGIDQNCLQDFAVNKAITCIGNLPEQLINQIISIAPYGMTQGMLTYNSKMQALELVGINPKFEANVSNLLGQIIAGDINDIASGSFNLILGEYLAQHLEVNIGDNLLLIIPETSKTGALNPKLHTVTVQAIFATGLDLDASTGYIHVDDLAYLTNLKANFIPALRIKLQDFSKATTINKAMRSHLPNDFKISDWTATRGSLFAAMHMEKVMISLLLSLVIIVAAFNIVAGLSMLVNTKVADIAILRTMGASAKQIMAIFMIQGAVQAIIGISLGVILALLLIPNISVIGNLLSSLNVGVDAYFINKLPTDLKYIDVITISTCALLLSLVAAFYPAYKASKLDPAALLRGI